MAFFYEYPITQADMQVNLDIPWSRYHFHEKDIKKSTAFHLYKLSQIPSFNAKLKVSLGNNWKKKILPPNEVIRKQFIDVVVQFYSAKSLFSDQLTLTKKGRYWEGTYSFPSPEKFHGGCIITAYVVRSQDAQTPQIPFAYEKHTILGQSQDFQINFVEGDASGGGEIDAQWVDFSTLPQPYNQFDQLFALEVGHKAIKLYLNNPQNPKTNEFLNADINGLFEGKSNKNREHRSALHDSIALPVQIIVLFNILITMMQGLQSNPSLTDDDFVELLSESHQKILLNFLQYFYPDITSSTPPRDDQIKKLKQDCSDPDALLDLINKRLLQAIQEQLGYQASMRQHTKKLR